jgi:hypothetical protein
MVVAMKGDVPEITVKFNFSDMEEKNKFEVESVIRCMNERGKFVSKAWVAEVMNFCPRKADTYFTALKKEGRIAEFVAITNRRKVGTYWRIPGKAMKRKMQLIHAKMRRSLCVSSIESINSPIGSLDTTREEPQSFSKPGGLEKKKAEDNFGPQEKVSLRHQNLFRNHEDGSPGDGRDHTFYTAKGCFERLTDPDNNPVEYEMMEKLLSVSDDGMLTPAAARSAARRIDSGVINKTNIDAICKIITEKKLAFDILYIVRNFEEILEQHVPTIRKDEIDCIADQIDEMTEGTSDLTVYKEIHLAYKALRPYIKLNPGHEYLTLNGLIGTIDSVVTIPTYAYITVIGLMQNVEKGITEKLINNYKDRIFREMIANRSVYEILKVNKNFCNLDWEQFNKERLAALSYLRTTLFVNKISNNKLNYYFNQLNFLETLNEHGNRQFTGVVVEHDTQRDFNFSGSAEQNSRAFCNS